MSGDCYALEGEFKRLSTENDRLRSELREIELDLRAAQALSEARREELVKCLAENRTLRAEQEALLAAAQALNESTTNAMLALRAAVATCQH